MCVRTSYILNPYVVSLVHVFAIKQKAPFHHRRGGSSSNSSSRDQGMSTESNVVV